MHGAWERVVKKARSRWILLTLAGAGVSFSVAVGLQALSGSHDDDGPRHDTQLEPAHRSQIPLATVAAVATAVEMPRPLPAASTSASASARHASPEARAADAHVVAPKAAHAWVPKRARDDLKNPFR
jgi:hypothetical protein